MGGLNVKNTIVERVLHIIAPHYCYGCGKIGTLLCTNCKYDIIEEPFLGCLLCGWPTRDGICELHSSALSGSIVVSERAGVLKALINGLKFHNGKAAALVLAELLDERLPLLPEGTLLVPVPTVRSHIRQRGYDHIDLIARHLARLRGLRIEYALVRQGNDTQHRLRRVERQRAAQQAFVLRPETLPATPLIVLLDDIITTGSTIEQASQSLAPLAVPILAATLAYQPLD